MGLSKQLKLSRNQPLKWHMWLTVALWDPKWSKQRIMLTKPISLVYAVDDIFDLYGTLQELTLFTEAVNQWDMNAAEKLPGYMRTCFMAVYDTTHEISRMVFEEHGWNPIEFLIKEWRNLFNAFLKEAKWFSSGEMPKAKEYLKNGVISSGVVMVLAHLFFLMGNCLTKETEILLSNDGVTYSVAKLLRLVDDLGTAQDEQQEGYDGSYIECYMKEHDGHSLESVHEHVMAMVSDTWETLNKQGLCSTSPFSPSFRKACLNAARMVPTMYGYGENHRLPVLEHHIKSLLRDTTFTKSIME
ncbi:probable terpene synthase 13 [Phtheirospermum japonicum]|uniref:Probable terpene synthase 13 n=1 Tax=Phtheirospermum japonicum TaxID=374723 RepID=A0A830CBB4_9LAMI|nr:probable terpene synthase 13 [Phtheirospermum japonicum]